MKFSSGYLKGKYLMPEDTKQKTQSTSPDTGTRSGMAAQTGPGAPDTDRLRRPRRGSIARRRGSPIWCGPRPSRRRRSSCTNSTWTCWATGPGSTPRTPNSPSCRADGHGVPAVKMGTWNRMISGMPPNVWMGWKNFYTEDKPMFGPGRTMTVRPVPYFISYQ